MCVWWGQPLFLEVLFSCVWCVWAGEDRRPSEPPLPSWSSHVLTLYLQRGFKSHAAIRPRPWPALILETHPNGWVISQMLSTFYMLLTRGRGKKTNSWKLGNCTDAQRKLSESGGKRSKCGQSWIRPLQRSAESAFCRGHWGTKCYYSCSADGGEQNAMAVGAGQRSVQRRGAQLTVA